MKSILIFILLVSLNSSVQAETLMITDSHGEGAFGAEMVRLLESRGDSVSVYAVGGSTAADWDLGLQQVWGYWEYHTGGISIRSQKPLTPKLEELLLKIEPDTVLIELGTNLIWKDLTLEDSLHVENLIWLVQKSGARCFWIGQPDLRLEQPARVRRHEEIKQLLKLKTDSSMCQLIPSWEFTHYPDRGGDGIHYDRVPGIGAGLAKKWAIHAVEFMK